MKNVLLTLLILVNTMVLGANVYFLLQQADPVEAIREVIREEQQKFRKEQAASVDNLMKDLEQRFQESILAMRDSAQTFAKEAQGGLQALAVQALNDLQKGMEAMQQDLEASGKQAPDQPSV